MTIIYDIVYMYKFVIGNNYMQYRYILFDLDGTLIDTTEGVLKSAQNALKHFGVFVETEKLMNFFGPPLKYSFSNLYGLSDIDSDKAIEIYNERYNRLGNIESRIFPEIKELLPKLKAAGYILGVATSKPQDQAVEILKFHSIIENFNVISGASADGTISKKDEVITEALKQFGLVNAHSSVIMVGDMKYDIIGAKKVGIDSFGIYTGTASENELENEGASYVAYSFSELENKLLVDFIS